LAPVLTPDPYVGRVYLGHLEELWDAARVSALRGAIAARKHLTILSGFGASVIVEGGVRVYVDTPKDRGQGLAAASDRSSRQLAAPILDLLERRGTLAANLDRSC
jgi:hypothetical protein